MSLFCNLPCEGAGVCASYFGLICRHCGAITLFVRGMFVLNGFVVLLSVIIPMLFASCVQVSGCFPYINITAQVTLTLIGYIVFSAIICWVYKLHIVSHYDMVSLKMGGIFEVCF